MPPRVTRQSATPSRSRVAAPIRVAEPPARTRGYGCRWRRRSKLKDERVDTGMERERCATGTWRRAAGSSPDAMRVVVYATMSMAAHLLPRLLGAMVGLRRQAQLTPPRTSFSRLVKRYFDAFD